MTPHTADGGAQRFTQTHSTSDRDNSPAPPPFPSVCRSQAALGEAGAPSTAAAPGCFHPRPQRCSDTSGRTQLAVKVKEGLGGGGREGEGEEICIPPASAAGGAAILTAVTRAASGPWAARRRPVGGPLKCDRPHLSTLGCPRPLAPHRYSFLGTCKLTNRNWLHWSGAVAYTPNNPQRPPHSQTPPRCSQNALSLCGGSDSACSGRRRGAIICKTRGRAGPLASCSCSRSQ